MYRVLGCYVLCFGLQFYFIRRTWKWLTMWSKMVSLVCRLCHKIHFIHNLGLQIHCTGRRRSRSFERILKAVSSVFSCMILKELYCFQWLRTVWDSERNDHSLPHCTSHWWDFLHNLVYVFVDLVCIVYKRQINVFLHSWIFLIWWWYGCAATPPTY
jgi:hypothetical protein